MKYLIVGLGNIGEKYENTRHNIGFKVLDSLCEDSNTFFNVEKLASIARIKHRGKILVLVKPATFMNLSGKAVNYWLQQEKIPLNNLIVVTDDLSLPFGKLRLRGKGSHGGHNGLRNINEVLNTENYARLRFGIGAEFGKGQQVDYVLGEWEKEELNSIEEHISTSKNIIKSFVSIGISRTMTEFNKK